MDIQSKFEGWAVVEMFGHNKIAGYVTTEYFGSGCLFRVEMPETQGREEVLEYATCDEDLRLVVAEKAAKS